MACALEVCPSPPHDGCSLQLTFSHSNQITGWAGLIRVDGTTYKWLGDPLGPNGPAVVTQNSYEYTSTKSIFSQDVDGKVALNITFLSPVTPDDFQRQSLIFSYMNVEVTSLDGAEHDVQLYSDISAGKLPSPVISTISPSD